MANNYYSQAQQQYDVGYNAKVQNMKNQLAQNQLALEQSKGGVNQNFDHQVGNQNLNNKIGKNNMSNSMLGRGLGNSSIAVTGLAEADQINNRKVGDINMNRTNALNDIEGQKAQLAQGTNNSIAQMGADREDAIQALARQLEDRQWDKDFKNKQFDFTKEQGAFDNAFKDKQFAYQQQQGAFDNNFKNQQLSMQQQAQANEQAYKNAMMNFEKEKYNKAMEQQQQPEINQYSDNAMYALEQVMSQGTKRQQIDFLTQNKGKYDGVKGFETYNKALQKYYDQFQYN